LASAKTQTAASATRTYLSIPGCPPRFGQLLPLEAHRPNEQGDAAYSGIESICVRVAKSSQRAIALLATPLSQNLSSSVTGGFASPSLDGFAFNTATDYSDEHDRRNR